MRKLERTKEAVLPVSLVFDDGTHQLPHAMPAARGEPPVVRFQPSGGPRKHYVVAQGPARAAFRRYVVLSVSKNPKTRLKMLQFMTSDDVKRAIILRHRKISFDH